MFYNPSISRKSVSVTLPSTISATDDNPFVSCNSLETIGVDAANAWLQSVGGALLSADGKRLFSYPAGAKAGSYAKTAAYHIAEIFTWGNTDKKLKAARQNEDNKRAELDATLEQALAEINAKWKADQDIISAWSDEAAKQRK